MDEEKSIIDIKDGERLAEMLWSSYGEAIHSQETFDEKWEEYYEPTAKQNRDLKPVVFEAFVRDHPIAGRIEAEEFKPQEKPKRKPGRKPSKPKRKYNYSGYIKKRLVYARPTSVNIKYRKAGQIFTKKIVRFRDSRGRFVKLFGKSKIKPEKIRK